MYSAAHLGAPRWCNSVTALCHCSGAKHSWLKHFDSSSEKKKIGIATEAAFASVDTRNRMASAWRKAAIVGFHSGCHSAFLMATFWGTTATPAVSTSSLLGAPVSAVGLCVPSALGVEPRGMFRNGT